jgi:hypothetical protein
MTNVKPARNFAVMICISLIGFVSKSSIVPDRLSSAKNRIVMAGIKKRNTKGAILNKPSIDAYPMVRTL